MINNRWFILTACWLLLFSNMQVNAQSIADKKASLKSSGSDLDLETEQLLSKVNRDTEEILSRIKSLYDNAGELYEAGANENEFLPLLEQIKENKNALAHLEQTWRDTACRSNRVEQYGLWHTPETTLEQLIIDYGSQDFVYLIPPEVAVIKLSIDSNLPIPRSAWNEMLELILAQNGIGIKPLNSYLRQLYLIKQNHSNLKLITNCRDDLEVIAGSERVCLVLSPEPSEVRRVYLFLEKFINPNTTVLHVLGRDILLIGPVSDIQDLLKLYDFVGASRGDKEYKLVPVFKVKADEMAHILEAMFDQPSNSNRKPVSTKEGVALPPATNEANGLRVIVLDHMAQALFLVGTKEEVKKAEEIVQTVECQIGGARDKMVYWYTVKHSDAEELADVLYRVYNLMISTGTGLEAREMPFPGHPPLLPPQMEPPPPVLGQDSLYQDTGFLINPAPAQPGVILPEEPNLDRDNFIVDIKTGSIVMVVETDVLPKLKDLMRKLDVPKKMVQIETLLFEKVLVRENNFGLNLLRIGDVASQLNITGAVFNNIFPNCKDFVPGNRGVFEFFLSRKKTSTGIPAFDLAYRFLLSQDDVQINSSPSIMTINQTPATIAINEDISINTGVFEVPNNGGGVTLKDAFARAQYGITISIKPTIHIRDETDNEEYDYVTLETDVTFDTIHPGENKNQPNVTRRHITNQVQVPDGETVILGGLRRKVIHDKVEKFPFICELPGIGKLLSPTTLKDNSTEMFIFITPHIVHDPKEQLACLRQELLCLRPGDTPYFLECVEEAHRYDKTRLMQSSMLMLLGRPPARYYVTDDCCTSNCLPEGEYDGR